MRSQIHPTNLINGFFSVFWYAVYSVALFVLFVSRLKVTFNELTLGASSKQITPAKQIVAHLQRLH